MTRRRRRRARRAQRRGWMTLGVAAALFLFALAFLHFRNRPQDLPWTRLDLGQPVGWFTGAKLAALDDDYPLCKKLLKRAGVRFAELEPVTRGQCGYADAVRLDAGGARTIGFDPARPGMACPVAAALSMWEWNVVQPAALRRFGSRVVTFEHFGTYNCRPIAGSSSLSQHSYARAIDIAGFVLANGRRITVMRDWWGKNDAAAFLRDVRNGACELFSTTLSPDYNAAHHDHLHLDEQPRGGWRACR
jgi:hypothetical protein